MVIHEPMTVATDYALAVANAGLAILSWRRGVRLWALMFACTAAGSFFGGTYHGTAVNLWWKPTVISIGLASFFLLLGATRSRVVQLFALIAFMAYATWMIGHDSFLWVIVDYGVALLLLLVIEVHAYARDRAPAAPWIIAGIVTSIVAAAVQQAPTRWHNDVYHVIQLLAMWLLYRGGLLLPPATRKLRTATAL